MASGAPSSLDDPQRRAVLHSTGLLDTPADERLDRLTRLAGQLLHAPITAISVVDDKREWFKSAVGLPEPFGSRRDIPLQYSFCKYVVSSGRRLVVKDARKHRWLRNNPAIEELGMVAYMGAPLRTSSGQVFGSFFLSDSVPRVWRKAEIRALDDFAGMAQDELTSHALRPRGSPPEESSSTARTAIDELLSTSDRFLTLVEQSIAGIAILQDGRFRYANQACAKMFDYTTEELLALGSVLDLIADQDRAMVAENLRQRLEGEVLSLRYQFRGRRKEGGTVHIEVHGTRAQIDGRPAVVSILLDVTERVQTEEALRSNEVRMRRLLDLAHDAFIAINENGIILEWNKQAERTFGWSSEDAIGTPLAETILPKENREAHEQGIKHFLASGEGRILDRRVEMLARHKSGHTLPVELTVTPIKQGDSYFFSSFLHDISARKRAEEALRQSEERFRRSFEDDLTGNLITRPDGTILACNAAFVRIFGYDSVEEALGINAIRIFGSPEARQQWVDLIRAEGRVEMHESELFRKDGQKVQVVENAVGTSDETGKLVEIRRYIFDVTERKRAELALQQSEERFRLVARATNDVLWEWDIGSGEVLWSEAAPKVFRYTASDLEPSIEWWVERIHPEDRERVVGGLHRVIDGAGDVWSTEYPFLRGDGSYATILDRGYVVRDEKAGARRAIGSMMDITDRRRAEEAQRLLARASALLESSLDPAITLPAVARSVIPTLADYCLVDLLEDDRMRRSAAAHAVPAEEALLEIGKSEPLEQGIEGRLAAKVIRNREPVLVPEVGRRQSKEGVAGAEHWKHLKRLGTHSLMMVPLVTRDQLFGIITLATAQSGRRYGPVELLVAQDLARRIALSLENARLYRHVQVAVQDREQILSMISHDLRNPLNTILTSTQLLRDLHKERRTENLKWLDVIERSGKQMERMVEDLLDLSSIDAGQFSVDPADHDLSSLIVEACESFRPLATQNSLKIRCECKADGSRVRLDSHRIMRVFSNLVGNALKFTPAGGTITLRADPGQDEVRLSVRDTGPGIPAEEVPHVFDRYWQAQKGDRRGAGLGLAIARGIVEAHGGRIWVESVPGRGTTFWFTVPATRA
jgi:PAS domain S-box-containing protein